MMILRLAINKPLRGVAAFRNGYFSNRINEYIPSLAEVIVPSASSAFFMNLPDNEQTGIERRSNGCDMALLYRHDAGLAMKCWQGCNLK